MIIFVNYFYFTKYTIYIFIVEIFIFLVTYIAVIIYVYKTFKIIFKCIQLTREFLM